MRHGRYHECRLAELVAPSTSTAMFPMFNDDERRKKRMNLGGAAVASHDEILQNAKQVREQRAQQRLKEDCALFVQSAWRSYLVRQRVKDELRWRIDSDPESAEALRCLAWLNSTQDWTRMVLWAERVLANPSLSEYLK